MWPATQHGAERHEGKYNHSPFHDFWGAVKDKNKLTSVYCNLWLPLHQQTTESQSWMDVQRSVLRQLSAGKQNRRIRWQRKWYVCVASPRISDDTVIAGLIASEKCHTATKLLWCPASVMWLAPWLEIYSVLTYTGGNKTEKQDPQNRKTGSNVRKWNHHTDQKFQSDRLLEIHKRVIAKVLSTKTLELPKSHKVLSKELQKSRSHENAVLVSWMWNKIHHWQVFELQGKIWKLSGTTTRQMQTWDATFSEQKERTMRLFCAHVSMFQRHFTQSKCSFFRSKQQL